jgi:hypothetical protein
MAAYKIFDFFMTGDIFTENNYPIEEYQKYLESFFLVPFSFDGIIKSLHFSLAIPSSSRVCNGYAYDKTYDQILASGSERYPKPVCFFTLTLWRTGEPEIKINR